MGSALTMPWSPEVGTAGPPWSEVGTGGCKGPCRVLPRARPHSDQQHLWLPGCLTEKHVRLQGAAWPADTALPSRRWFMRGHKGPAPLPPFAMSLKGLLSLKGAHKIG